MANLNFYTSVEVFGKNILYRGVHNGKRIQKKVKYDPKIYLSSKQPTDFKSLDGEYLSEYIPGDISKCREFIKMYDQTSTKIFGQRRFEYCFISDAFNNEVEWDRGLINVCNLDIEVLGENGFPEPEKADDLVTAITMKSWDKYHVFTCIDYKVKADDVVAHICVDEKDLLRQFLDFWSADYPDIITGWNVKPFDILYLVNRIKKILGPDVAKRLSPWNYIREEHDVVMNRDIQTYTISGIAVWDYLEIFRKYSKGGYSHDSYKLGSIAMDVIGRGKVDYGKYGSLSKLYHQNPDLYIDYNIEDVRLVNDIDVKEGLFNLCLVMAYDSKVNYEDIFSQIKMWDVLIYNELKKKNIILPPMASHRKDTSYEGAFVKEPIKGLHEWVVSFDITSMYPSLIMQYNLSPETLMQKAKLLLINNPAALYIAGKMNSNSIIPGLSVQNFLEETVDPVLLQACKAMKVSLCPNGAVHDNSKHGFLPEMIQTMFNDRSRYKEMMKTAQKELEKAIDKIKEIKDRISKYDNLQGAKKVSLNSVYGAAGAVYFRFYDVRMAEAVTYSGQYVIKYTEKRINAFLNRLLGTNDVDYVIAVDTDSMYLNLETLVKRSFPIIPEDKNVVVDFLSKICADDGPFQKELDKIFNHIAEYTNAFQQKMYMKRESICDKVVWTGKKRYILNVYDNENVRYAKPKVKISGLEAIKSSTPPACRKKIKEAINIILTGKESDMITLISDFKKEFKTLPIEDISFPKSVNGLDKYKSAMGLYIKGTPVNTKGSLIYNSILLKKNLDKVYPKIQEGDKIKYVYLAQPNPYRSDVIAFPETAPIEFDLPKYIDYTKMFDIAFLGAIKIVLDVIKWKTEKVRSLGSVMKKE